MRAAANRIGARWPMTIAAAPATTHAMSTATWLAAAWPSK